MKKKKVYTKNEWKVIHISELPDGVPVLAVQEMHSKSFAEFHLTEYVLAPIDGVWPKQQEVKVKSLKTDINP